MGEERSGVAKATIEKADVSGRRVLMRVDFNVPMEDGRITDDRRIREALPSIVSVLDRKGRLILISHMGRPAGTGYEEPYSLEPCAKKLTQMLAGISRGHVGFPSKDCVDAEAAKAVDRLADGEVILLENLRFHKAEKKGDEAFAAKLAAYGDIYCNNAFGTCHRPDASMVAVPRLMKGKARVCGSLVEKEIRYLSEALESPSKPFVVILGGAKVSDKLPAVEFLSGKASDIVIGGAMAYTFLKARGVKVGTSRVEDEMVGDARRMLASASERGCTIHLPIDHVCSTTFDDKTGENQVFTGDIGDGFMGLDIGPATRDAYVKVIEGAKTIVWNGPMGVFEKSIFAVGTRQVAEAVARATGQGAISIVGGGDSAAAAEQFGVAELLTHVSTGGGASLEMLSGQEFESVALLDDA
ncbi:MAG: phosphoglycerate kinase [Phycisphaerales bacterium]|nr:phosphoglycerate kinase [Phycisphaerales bacterium]